ncbi:acetylglutamate kinase [Companilactobacillus sp.]|jgi:acetylglutamate kinase|uniref:acetylglutamate kinase n=1 Tax=Companilactobacillus sp. TaxID=2767905 RepID=UPI0025B842AC|nr:acetylglutamate kinase [Companilactobacillus sp.]MCH4009194.1 acetylglutamate kinase [Companilactobacillus sp.]MCH4050627.1 acetylglutamate kinase [Companilactobacillus sp.]MCH4077136.1 acetylglutamate kinase [Companilactobacillus sp.]MCH4125712.1 acetylglutamate kinase [Companilactobacillus sp.]MCI1311421.1 acetylglutamate kinase [Companilactobacillus sp.]
MKETIVIKIGGNASDQLPATFFKQIKDWWEQGKKILIIHGGGPQISQWSEKMHLSVKKIDGIRVTNSDTLNVTKAVLLGLVQPKLCQFVANAGLPVIGMNASDNHLLQGNYLNQSEYGEVGKVTKINKRWLDEQLQDQIGILAPLAQTADGHWLNVNADMAAATIAIQLGAESLVLLTDVPGVLNSGKVVPQLTETAANQLFQKDVIKSGMMPKIQASFRALKNGVNQTFITNDLGRPGTQFQY